MYMAQSGVGVRPPVSVIYKQAAQTQRRIPSRMLQCNYTPATPTGFKTNHSYVIFIYALLRILTCLIRLKISFVEQD